MMLTLEQFDQIDVGDTFDAGEIFQGMTHENVVWVCQEKLIHPKRHNPVAVFGIHYFNTDLGRIQAELVKGKIEYKEVS